MNNSWLDLHMHSLYSDDGEFTPSELIDQCEKAGVKVMAIADHNSIKGVAEAVCRGKEQGITCIPAIEIDCTIKGTNLHVLGYGIDITMKEFTEIEENVERQEIAGAQLRMEKVLDLGILFDKEAVLMASRNGVVTGEMIGEAALLDKRNDDNPLLFPYRPGGSRSDNPFVNFYWDFCAAGKSAYVHIIYPSLAETVSVIQKSGGVPVLAHPGNNIGCDKELFAAIIAKGIQGVEAYSSYHSPEIINFYVKAAKQNNLLTTCGSDFHGHTKPAIHLGSIACDRRENEIQERLEYLIQRSAK